MPVIVFSSIIYRNVRCEDDNLEPCRKHPSYPESMFCENINDIQTFVNVIRCSSKKHMQEVFLEKSTLDFLPLYTLDFCGFFFLNVKSVVLSKLLEGNVLVRLQQLHLDAVIVKNPWTWEPLSVLKKLLRFSVANMRVSALDGRLVDHLTDKLRSLILTTTNTTEISEYALEKFADLEYISVQNNEISELRRSMFPSPAKIKFFYFGKNKIESLPDDMFQDMPNLQHIALDGNLISEMLDSTFKPVWNHISKLLLQGNPLKCHCKMLWLAKRKTPDIFTGSCYAPKHKYGKLLNSLSIQDFQCF